MHYDPTGHITTTASNGMMVNFEPSAALDRKYIKYVMAATQSKVAKKITKESYYVASYYTDTNQLSELAGDYPELAVAVSQQMYKQAQGQDLFSKKQLSEMGLNVGLYNKKVGELDEVRNIINNEVIRDIINRFNERMGQNSERFGRGIQSFIEQFWDHPGSKALEEYSKFWNGFNSFCDTPFVETLGNGINGAGNWLNKFSSGDINTKTDMAADLSWLSIEQLIYVGATYGIGEGAAAERSIAKYLDELKVSEYDWELHNVVNYMEYKEQLRKVGQHVPQREYIGQYSGKLIKVNTKDPGADLLAKRLNGDSRVYFESDIYTREFDAVSDLYIGQAKQDINNMGQRYVNQVRETFGAARDSGRTPYFQFEGKPADKVLAKIKEIAEQYGMKYVIDTNPLNK